MKSQQRENNEICTQTLLIFWTVNEKLLHFSETLKNELPALTCDFNDVDLKTLIFCIRSFMYTENIMELT